MVENRSIRHKYPWMILLILSFIATSSIAVICYSFTMGNHITQDHAEHVYMSNEAKLETTKAHLWLEELVSGDKKESVASVIKHLDKARLYLSTMLDGDIENQPNYSPVNLDHPEVRSNIKESIDMIDLLKEESKTRYLDKINQGVGTSFDAKYDKNYKALITKIDVIENSLDEALLHNQESYFTSRNSIIAIILFLNIMIVVFHKSIIKFDREWLSENLN